MYIVQIVDELCAWGEHVRNAFWLPPLPPRPAPLYGHACRVPQQTKDLVPALQQSGSARAPIHASSVPYTAAQLRGLSNFSGFHADPVQSDARSIKPRARVRDRTRSSSSLSTTRVQSHPPFTPFPSPTPLHTFASLALSYAVRLTHCRCVHEIARRAQACVVQHIHLSSGFSIAPVPFRTVFPPCCTRLHPLKLYQHLL